MRDCVIRGINNNMVIIIATIIGLVKNNLQQKSTLQQTDKVTKICALYVTWVENPSSVPDSEPRDYTSTEPSVSPHDISPEEPPSAPYFEPSDSSCGDLSPIPPKKTL